MYYHQGIPTSPRLLGTVADWNTGSTTVSRHLMYKHHYDHICSVDVRVNILSDQIDTCHVHINDMKIVIKSYVRKMNNFSF